MPKPDAPPIPEFQDYHYKDETTTPAPYGRVLWKIDLEEPAFISTILF